MLSVSALVAAFVFSSIALTRVTICFTTSWTAMASSGVASNETTFQ